jgi:YidC/Oxa1 family membrane protein insertase
MEKLRVLLWGGFIMSLYLVYSQWTADYAVAKKTPTNNPASATMPGSAQPLQDDPSSANTLLLSDSKPELYSLGQNETNKSMQAPTNLVTLSNDVLEVKINPNRGADIVNAVLLGYFLSKDDTENKVQLLSLSEDAYHYFQTGLLSTENNGSPEPNHQQPFLYIRTNRANDGSKSAIFRWESSNIAVNKTYTLTPGSFEVKLAYEIINKGYSVYPYVQYSQIIKKDAKVERSIVDVETYSFDGGIIFNGESYEKLHPEDLVEKPVMASHLNGWLANIKHHFVVAAIPEAEESFSYQATYDEGKSLEKISAVGETTKTVFPGGTQKEEMSFYIGPKLQSKLKELRPGLERSVDYGALSFLSKPLFWLLEKIHSFVGNWGLSIILVTFCIKLVFYRLAESSGKSMARMRLLAPRIKAIQERFKDDKQAAGQATMELYKKEKVNPLAGCWPMLVQVPFFIAFYWVLLESVEIRQAPFFLWIQDLSSRDPYFILPILMGAGMFFQQKLNPPPPDPMQAKVMSFLPVVFTGMFAFFPSGLVLYWLTNSLLSIAQQWRLNKKFGTKVPVSSGGDGG